MTDTRQMTPRDYAHTCALSVGVSAARAALAVTLAASAVTAWWIDRVSRRLAELDPKHAPNGPPNGAEARDATVLPLLPDRPGHGA